MHKHNYFLITLTITSLLEPQGQCSNEERGYHKFEFKANNFLLKC